GQFRKRLVQELGNRLSRSRPSIDLRRMHADDELEVRAGREPLHGLAEPVEHRGKGIRLVVELCVPYDVGEKPDHRPRTIQPELMVDRSPVLARPLMKPDPVFRAGAPAAEITHRPLLERWGELQPFPGFQLFRDQGAVIAVVMAEDEAMSSVSGVPRDGTRVALLRDFRDDALRYVDPVMRDDYPVGVSVEQPKQALARVERRAQIAPEHRLAARLSLERA